MLTLLAASPNTNLLAQPGTIAFVIVFGMGVVCFFLFRSMSRHLRKVNQAARDEAEAAEAAEREDEAAHSAGGGAATG
ncbi:MAG TPA: hypothetical protein VGM14_22160 [Streptosporangiaceae bacterium]